MGSKHFLTIVWQFVLMPLVCSNSFAAEANTNGPTSLVQATNSVAITNSAINPVLTFELKPTVIASVGASGSAEFKASDVSVHLTGLGPAVYELEAVRRSDGVRRTVGAITIADPTASPSRQATDNKKEASANPESVRVDTDARLKTPKGLDVQDVTRVMLTVGGNAVLDSQAK